METSTKITYATLSSDELELPPPSPRTTSAFQDSSSESASSSRWPASFSWNMYHLGLNFEELYRDSKALSRRTFLFRRTLYMPAISSMKVQVTTTDAQDNSWSIQEFC